MKSSLPLLVLGGWLVVPPSAFSQEARAADTINHRVAEVTVYRDRALVTRQGSTSLSKGIHELVFERLPVALDENSIRASGEGTAGFKILGVELRRKYEKPVETGELAAIRARFREINDRRAEIEGDRGNLNQQQQFLTKMRDKVLADTKKVSESSEVVSVKSLEEIFTFYSRELAAITTRQRELQVEERKLNEEQAELHKKMALIQRPASADTRMAVVKVNVEKAGQARLDLSYIIRGATWTPQYDAFSQRKDKKVALTYYGIVRQTTGENWEDVKLTLSTARPNQNARLPLLGTWTIGLQGQGPPSVVPAFPTEFETRDQGVKLTVKPQNSARIDEAQSSSGPVDYEGFIDHGQPITQAKNEAAKVVDNGPVATFEVPGTVTIPSDNQPHRTTVDQIALEADFAYEATPKLVEAAFLRATVANGKAPLLPGKINVFQGNDYIGQSYIGLVAAGAKFDLYLGTDDGIKITRVQKVPKEEMGGIITSVKRYELGYSIKVENIKGTAEKIIIHDQLPVSNTGEVTVAVQQMAKGAKQNKDTGELTWEFELGAKQTRDLAVSYQIECPPDKNVTGLLQG